MGIPAIERGSNPRAGRYPPHLLLTHSAACAPDACAADCPAYVIGQQSGVRDSGGYPPEGGQRSHVATYGNPNERGPQLFAHSTGTAARYFPQFWPEGDDAPFLYAAKASRAERNRGCEGMEERDFGVMMRNANNTGDTSDGFDRFKTVHKNTHPTVKNQALMRWLVRLITPPGGACLDPFMGSGSTGVAAIAEGRGFVGIEMSTDYYAIAAQRIADAADPLRRMVEEAA
jgi:site-specific DNA-methyltransferase (adenine-specific)